MNFWRRVGGLGTGLVTANPALLYMTKENDKKTKRQEGIQATDATNQAEAERLFAETGQLTPYGSASEMAARTLDAQYANWETQFMPIELDLLNQSSLNNPDILPTALNRADATVNQVFDSMAGVEQRKLASRGITPNADESMVSSRVRNLSRAAAIAGAENRTREQIAAQDEQIALGSVPNQNIVQQAKNSKYA